eukprot:GEMP01022468.1.p1 GENE.GEMP01022468.1~~GEMP01022468.1.p1  ORF type:complete len:494 (+),score=129.28 GEMP01022468.1:178-1659(+)
MDVGKPAVDAVDAPVNKEQLIPTASARNVGTKQPVVVVAPNPPQRQATSTEEVIPMEEVTSTKEGSLTEQTEAPTAETVTLTEKPAKEKNSVEGKTSYRSLASRLSLGSHDRHSGRDSTTEMYFVEDTTDSGDMGSAYNNYYANYTNYVNYAMSPQGRLAASNAALQTALENYWAQMQIASTYLMPSGDANCYSTPYYQPVNAERVSISLESSLRPSKVDLRLSKAEEVELGDATTIMLRNIPNRYTREMLIDEFESNDVLKNTDFFYLPIDLRHRRNVGYCFLNLVSTEAVADFVSKFDNFKLEKVKSGKTCHVARAIVQGREANIEQYRNSAVISMDDNFHPIILKDGKRIRFPSPTKSKEKMRAHQPEIKGVSSRNFTSVNSATRDKSPQNEAGSHQEQKNGRDSGKKVNRQSQQQKRRTETNEKSSSAQEENDVAPKKKKKRNSKGKSADKDAKDVAQEDAKPGKSPRRSRKSRNSHGNGQEAPAKISE